MSAADNVTPIDGAAASRPARRPKARPGLVLAESGEYDGFCTRDVVNGLRGVCLALDVLDGNADVDLSELATAAMVLSAILQNRVE